MDKTIKILMVLFAVVGLGLLGYYWIHQWHTDAVQRAVEAEQSECLRRIVQLEAQIAKLESEVDTPLPADELIGVFGPEKPSEAVHPEAVDCKRITTQVAAFFHYLDSKGHINQTDIDMRAEDLFQQSFDQLAAKPPTNVGEMNSLYGLLLNVTHFYRVLGKDRLLLIKEIMDEEAAVMEPAMSVLFTWMTVCDESRPADGEPTKLNALYQYAAYFLNTLGGRSYLLRRDSRTRMLVSYYALLVIDMANDARRNEHGIDIRPHLDYLFYDINNQKGLLYRERYLTRLAALRDKYF